MASAIYSDTRENLAKTDVKASILSAAIGVVSAVVLGAALAGDWTPAELPFPAEIAAWVAVGGVYIALLLAGAAIYPRIKIVNPRRLTFVGHVAATNDTDALRDKLEREAERGRDCRTTEQLFVLSKAARAKYCLLQAALLSLGLSSLLLIVAILLAAVV